MLCWDSEKGKMQPVVLRGSGCVREAMSGCSFYKLGHHRRLRFLLGFLNQFSWKPLLFVFLNLTITAINTL